MKGNRLIELLDLPPDSYILNQTKRTKAFVKIETQTNIAEILTL